MFAILRQRNFALLWMGAVISRLGDWLLLIVLPLFVYQRTGSALATGIMFIVETLPGLCFGSLAGVFADRWDRRRTMIVTDLLRALILLPLFLVQEHAWLWLAYGIVFIQATISQFFTPAQGALIPLLVGEEHLTMANAMNSLGMQLMRLIGPLLGGVLFELLGFRVVIMADSLSYIFSGLMSLLVMIPAGTSEKLLPHQPPHKLTHSLLWQEWLEGLKLLQADRVVRILFFISGTAMLGDGIIRAVGTPFLSQVVGGNVVLFSWIGTAQGVGAVAGSLVLARFTKVLNPFKLLAWGAVLDGILGFIEVTFPTFPIVIACTALMGAPIVFFFVSIYTVLQQSVSDQFRGRMLGIYGSVNMTLYLVGMICSSLLTIQLSVRYVFLIGETFYLFAGIAAFLWLDRTRSEKLPVGTMESNPGREIDA